MTYLPSKKFIIATLIILLAGAGIFWLAEGKKLGKENKIVFQKQGSPSIFQQNKENSDWEQVLLKAGVYIGVNASSSETIDTNSESISETEKLSQQFLSQYLIAKQVAGGGNLDETTKQDLINSLAQNINSDISVSLYTLSDIKISSDNSREAIKNYGNQLGLILKNHINPPPSFEILVFGDMVENNDQTDIEQLEESIKNYEGLIKDCLGLTASSALKDSHLKLINSFVYLKEITARFKNFFNDPIASLAGLKDYQTALTNFTSAVTTINNYFKNQGIIFNKDEEGFFIQDQLK